MRSVVGQFRLGTPNEQRGHGEPPDKCEGVARRHRVLETKLDTSAGGKLLPQFNTRCICRARELGRPVEPPMVACNLYHSTVARRQNKVELSPRRHSLPGNDCTEHGADRGAIRRRIFNAVLIHLKRVEIAPLVDKALDGSVEKPEIRVARLLNKQAEGQRLALAFGAVVLEQKSAATRAAESHNVAGEQHCEECRGDGGREAGHFTKIPMRSHDMSRDRRREVSPGTHRKSLRGKEWALQDLNLRPTDYESAALTN